MLKQLLLVLDNPQTPARDISVVEPVTGIEPAPLCLLGSRSAELSYTGMVRSPREVGDFVGWFWYPAQESNPEQQASRAGLRPVSRGNSMVREAGFDPATNGL